MDLSVTEENGNVTSHGTTETSDELLVAAAKSGDSVAFVELCRRHSKKILPRIYRITKNREDAEDVLQDSFLRAFVHLKGFEGRSSFSSWLTRIAINSALMHLRKRRGLEIPIGHFHDHLEMPHAWEPADHSGTPESQYARRERQELLRTAVSRLPLIFREVVELQHAEECSPTEIAYELGISVSAAKTRLSRARMAVRQSFARRKWAS